jgi:hypothetical protein
MLLISEVSKPRTPHLAPQVMHGVEVTAGSRYSLVLWLSDSEASVRTGATPWLKIEAERGDAYAQFLYAESLR